MTRRRSLADGGAVALTVVATVGALLAVPVPVPVAVVAVAVAWRLGRPALVVLAVGALASGLGHGAVEGARPAPFRTIDGIATLVSDPVPRPDRCEPTSRRRHPVRMLTATGSTVGVLRPRLAGELVRVRGLARPRPEDSPWLARRHVVGRMG